MSAAFRCVLLALTIYKGGSRAEGDVFRPTPIPLSEWHDVAREARAGTLHETIKTESPPSVAAVPAHYWEDALRHSVYLTLVRDKIDQLITQSDVASPNTKADKQISKEVDDRDLWEKIKTAPFDRIPEDDPSSFGDVAIMARGRLLEENDGFRFTEDERSTEKCTDDKCMNRVKAIWSVKRIRQRDHETSPGRYHYELTFSVISQTPKKQKKPYENPIRTFTVRESTPDRTTEAPQQHKKHEKTHSPAMRPERAIWIHRNIVPTKYHLGRSYYHGLDRIFSSLFSDQDYDEEISPESSPRHQSNSYVPQAFPPHSKAGYVGAPTDQYQQNVKYLPYPYKQIKNSRPIPPPPLAPTYQYTEANSAEIPNANQYSNSNQYNNGNHYSNNNQYGNGNQYTNENQNSGVSQYTHGNEYVNGNNQYTNGNQYNRGNQYTNGNHHHHNGKPHTLQSDYRGSTSNKPVRTTRPAVLPTPLPPIMPTKDLSFEVGNMMRFGNETTHVPETITIYKNYNKFRAPPGKVNYFSEHVRPPIYNAPPGVFVTMDKKPFKPMPPLKLAPTTKPLRSNRPIDFRPSPQILDGQSTERDSFIETAFMPITTHYTDNSTENGGSPETFKKGVNKPRKTHGARKPAKKHENAKTQKTSTNAPDIVTAAKVTEEDTDSMEWANVLGAFTKTTPFESVTEKLNIAETTASISTTEPASNSNGKRRANATIETDDEATTITTTTTTQRPKKRTRPPPKFAKQDKIKKHKRVTTTTTTSTTQTPEKTVIKKTIKDLTPQASSAAVSSTKSLTESTSKKPTTTSTATTTTSTTPYTTSITTTTKTPRTTKTSTASSRPTAIVSETKNKNRFRQSTLMLKGTSVKHDKWNTKNQTSSTASEKYRRKGSNFQGYLSSPSPSSSDQETRKSYHPDGVSEISTSSAPETTRKSEVNTQLTATEQVREENDSAKDTTADHYREEEYDESDEERSTGNADDEASKDKTEFIFQSTTSQPADTNNEVIGLEEYVTIDRTVDTSPHSVPKNKTKCKKKKTSEDKTEHGTKIISVTPNPTTTTTEKPTTSNIFQDLFDFNFNSTPEKENEITSTKPDLDETESENHEQLLKIDEDLKDFIDNLGEKPNNTESNRDDDEHYNDDDDEEESPSVDDEDSDAASDDEPNSGRQSSDANYGDYQDRPYSFLELLAME